MHIQCDRVHSYSICMDMPAPSNRSLFSHLSLSRWSASLSSTYATGCTSSLPPAAFGRRHTCAAEDSSKRTPITCAGSAEKHFTHSTTPNRAHSSHVSSYDVRKLGHAAERTSETRPVAKDVEEWLNGASVVEPQIEAGDRTMQWWWWWVTSAARTVAKSCARQHGVWWRRGHCRQQSACAGRGRGVPRCSR